MIRNNMCNDCWHQYVCDKIKTLAKFKDDEKGYIGVDITIDKCIDFIAPDCDTEVSR